MYPPPSTDGNAIAALILAIASFVACPIIPAIVALVLAGKAKRNIQASGGAKTGESLVTAARVIAWIHLGLVSLLVVLGLVALAVGRSSGVSIGP
jgi:hypothetical protein